MYEAMLIRHISVTFMFLRKQQETEFAGYIEHINVRNLPEQVQVFHSPARHPCYLLDNPGCP